MRLSQEGPCRYTKDKRAAIPAAYVDIKKGDEKMMKEAVATVGPISVAMDGRYMGFYLYSGGNCSLKAYRSSCSIYGAPVANFVSAFT